MTNCKAGEISRVWFKCPKACFCCHRFGKDIISKRIEREKFENM